MSLPRYPGYKDSGEAWLGEVPAHWGVTKLRYVSTIRKGKLPGQIHPSKINGSDLPYLSMEYLRCETEDPSYVALAHQALCAEPEDILILWDGSNAGEFLRAKKGVVSSTVALIENTKIQRDFLFYLCKASQGYIQDKTIGMGIPHVSGNELRMLPLSFPTTNEQTAIAAFLDHETAKIDGLIAEQEKLIALLAEKRQATISHAVTKGLNPAAPMKDSGVPYLGVVPANWTIKKIKNVVSMRSGEGITSEDIENEGAFPVYGGNGLRGYTNRLTHTGEYLLVGRQGALCGNVHHITGEFWASEHAVVCTFITNDIPRWAFYMLGFMDLGQYSVSAAQPGLAVERIQQLSIAVPPEEEQRDIATFIDAEVARLEALTVEATHGIALLKERRSALISAAVTGKIDVRHVAEQKAA
jgi:type I restriction enzyme S subunit